VSTSEVWIDFPWSWRRWVPRLAEHFRVIAVDTRGHGRTASPEGPAGYDVLVEDLLALVDALDLSRPAFCGFSDGGHTATLFAMRHPERPVALVNYAGYDLFNPAAPSARIVRERQGGSATATAPELDGIEERIGAERLRLIVQDHDAGLGAGAWRRMFESGFERWTRPGPETLADFRGIVAPTLIEVGDRDPFCTVEEACVAYRNLPNGELCVLPGVDHSITTATVDAATAFLRRHVREGGSS
jgi:3-oxoadipate enol-lactonase